MARSLLLEARAFYSIKYLFLSFVFQSVLFYFASNQQKGTSMGDAQVYWNLVEEASHSHLNTIPAAVIRTWYSVEIAFYHDTNGRGGRPGKFLAELKRREYNVPLT